MIELTQQKMQAVENRNAAPPRLVNPQTNETFVLLRVEEYERLKADVYDDTPWTSGLSQLKLRVACVESCVYARSVSVLGPEK